MPQAELLPFGSNPLATLSTIHYPLSTIHSQLLSTPSGVKSEKIKIPLID
ncbi:MAG: hypothetical protein LBE12_10965 [Planctomycetaceae bacterium]|nr:hypothetical protein [Planctomycetaceae bacterium]